MVCKCVFDTSMIKIPLLYSIDVTYACNHFLKCSFYASHTRYFMANLKNGGENKSLFEYFHK